MRRRHRRWWLSTSTVGIALIAFAELSWNSICLAVNSPATQATGPLRVHPDNPRYFTDGTGQAIYLTGAHTWNNLQNNAAYPPVDYAEYLDFLEKHNHNFIRMWAWEQGGWDPWAAGHTMVEPVPFARMGPGQALDGRPKYDLTCFNADYFQQLRSNVIRARERGIYVSVMLFQGWSVEKKGQVGNPWQGHPFNKANNINGLDGDLNGDGQGPEIHTLDAAAEILERQRAYVRQVVDTVNDLDKRTAIAARATARDRVYDIAGHCARFFNSGDVRFWEMEPKGKLASTGVCLANDGEEYVVYSASGEPFTVDLSGCRGTTLETRWYDPRIGRSQPSTAVAGGNAATRFTPPLAADAVLHLKRKHL